MTSTSTRRALLSGLLPLVLAACGSSAAPAEDVRRSLLRHQQVRLHQRLFFVGLGEGATLDEATRNAYAEVTRQLTWLPRGSSRLLEGLYRVDRSATDRDGRIHALAVLEREAAASHLRKVAVEERASLRVVLHDCEGKLEAGEVPGARACAATAAERVQHVRDLYAAARAAVGDPPQPTPFPEEQQAARLASRVGEGEARGRSVLVHVLKVIDGEKTGDLDAEFGQVATQHGFRVVDGSITDAQVEAALEGSTKVLADVGRSSGAGYLIVGRVVGRFSSEESGQYFAWASGRVRLVETTSGRAVGDLSYDQIKGGHISRQQACDKAVQNAVAKLQADLKRKLAALP